MQTSIILAQILWPVFFVIGISLLLNTKHYIKMFREIKDSHVLTYFGSLLWIIFGIFLFLMVKQMETIVEVTLVILALTSIVKSMIFLIFPEYVQNIFKKPKKFEKYLPISALFYMWFGTYLSYSGYIIYI